jgi:hypothetical protein
MTRIFISYRRSDSTAHAGRIAASLRAHAASPEVFFDTTDIEPGSVWPQSLEKALATCDVMLVVIGPQWLAPAPGAAHSRLHDGDDIVAREIRTALRREGVRVIPVRVGKAALPAAADLPPGLEALLMRQSTELRDDAFDQDLGALAARLLSPPTRWPRVAAALAGVAVLAVLAWQLRPGAPPVVEAALPQDVDVEVHFTPHPLMQIARFPDRRVQLLQDLPEMRDAMPFKRMPTLADGRLVFLRNGYTLPAAGQSFVGRLSRDDIDSAIELAGDSAQLINTPVCFGVGKAVIAPAAPLQLDCKEGVGCTPEGDNGGLILPCGTRKARAANWLDLFPSAQAAPAAQAADDKAKAGDWVVPATSSLRERLASPRAVGYSEIGLSGPPLQQASTANRVALDLSINGHRLWVNALPAWATAVPYDPARGLQLAFGLENLNAAGASNGAEQLRIRVIYLREHTPVFEDTLVIDNYIALRTLPAATVRGQVLVAQWNAVYHPAPADRYQLLAYGNQQGVRDTLRVKSLIDGAQLPGPAGQRGPIVGVVRPPVRDGAAWGVALSVRQPSGQLRFSFDTDAAKALCSHVAASSEFKRLRLGAPLVRVIANEGDDKGGKAMIPCSDFGRS